MYMKNERVSTMGYYIFQTNPIVSMNSDNIGTLGYLMLSLHHSFIYADTYILCITMQSSEISL